MTVLLAFTDLNLFLSKGDTIDNIISCGFVRLGITLVLGFKDCLIFRAAEVFSQQTMIFFLIGQELPGTAALLPDKRLVVNIWRHILTHRVLRVDQECIAAFRTL